MDKLDEKVPGPLLEQLLAIAMGKGGDFAEIYVESTRVGQVSLEEQRIRHTALNLDAGVGIRVIAGDEVGYAYSEDCSPPALEQAAKVAAAIAQAGRSQRAPTQLGPAKSCTSHYDQSPLPSDFPWQEKIDMLRACDAAAHQMDPNIRQVMASVVDQTKHIRIANSEGVLINDTQMLTRLHVQVIVENQHGERRSGFYGGGSRAGFAHFQQVTPIAIAQEAARSALAQLGAKPAPVGPQTVILSPGWSGILLHEAVGHGLEADFIAKGTSLFAGKQHQQVASKACTIVDDGTLFNARGSINWDDEAEPSQRTVLIEQGQLKGYMVDKMSSRRMGIPSTGNGRRQSFRHPPMPRMTNTMMTAGDYGPDEIIASVSKGLYCASLGGGQVDITNGNFVFEVTEAYWIEQGKLTYPVENAMLIGIGPVSLQHVSMVGNDPKLDPGMGTCGKDGQTVPVGVGLPTVRIDNLTVGGREAQS